MTHPEHADLSDGLHGQEAYPAAEPRGGFDPLATPLFGVDLGPVELLGSSVEPARSRDA